MGVRIDFELAISHRVSCSPRFHGSYILPLNRTGSEKLPWIFQSCLHDGFCRSFCSFLCFALGAYEPHKKTRRKNAEKLQGLLHLQPRHIATCRVAMRNVVNITQGAGKKCNIYEDNALKSQGQEYIWLIPP